MYVEIVYTTGGKHLVSLDLNMVVPMLFMLSKEKDTSVHMKIFFVKNPNIAGS